MTAPRKTREGWQMARGDGAACAFIVCVLDRDHRVHLMSPVPCATRCGVVVDSRDRFRLSLRRTVYTEEACSACWAPFQPPERDRVSPPPRALP